MRVIAGEARGRPLKGPPKGPRGSGTRPTSDKVKGAIFSMLEAIMLSSGEPLDDAPVDEADEATDQTEGEDPDKAETAESGLWSGKRVLDLYAGTGALGIEALSRGAASAEFIDSSQACQRLIRENLRSVNLAERGRVSVVELPGALEREQGIDGAFDVVLLDPPYGDPSLERALIALEGRGLLGPEALVVVEHSRRGEPSEAFGSLRLIRRRRHGDTEISIYRREE
jgi:16S rRNA (guanine966-N2)-methyltransferase